VSQVGLLEHDLALCTPWFIDARVEDRDGLMVHLKAKGIGTRPMYPPINEQLAYNEFGHFPVSKEIGEKGLWLPSMIQLTDEQIIRICHEIKAYYR
jgi:perosamine synthetase